MCMDCEENYKLPSRLKPFWETIKEQNESYTFSKFDTNKNKLSLIEPTFIDGLGQVLTYGANKYAKDNWKQCDDIDRYKDALLRHLYAYLGGEDKDSESGLDHLDHVSANVMFIKYFEGLKR